MYTQDQTKQKMSSEDLEKLVDRAIKKVQGRKENDLCKYLPGPSGGYMHHFTMKKLKKMDPSQFLTLLQKFIIEKEVPKALDPKPRAPRGSRKRKDLMSFTRNDIEKVLELARKMGDKELVAKFSPKRPLTTLKRELVRSIRHNHVSEDLWSAYKEAVNAMHFASSNEGATSY